MKTLNFLGRCLTESLTSNTAPFVCILLTVPLMEHGTDLDYILPVMLFYACMKTGLYFLQGTVVIKNPYTVMKFGIACAFSGSLFLLDGDPSGWMYLVGAVLTGIGLAPVSSMYKYICDNEDPAPEHSLLRKIMSTAILVVIAAWCMKSKTSGSLAVFYFWCLYIGLILVYTVFLPEREKYKTKRTFVIKPGWFVCCIPSALLFFMMAAVSGYKSSGNTLVFILMTVSLVLFGIWTVIFDKRIFHRYCAQTSWLGAIRGFEMFFALVFLAETGKGNLTIVLYEAVLCAGFFGFVPDYIFRNLDSEKTLWICMGLSLACMAAVISGNFCLMIAGIFLCVCFTNKAKSCNLDEYTAVTPVIRDEYRLRQDKMYSLGNGTFQAFTIIVFFIAGKIISGHGNGVINAYILASGFEHGRTVLFASGLICVIVLLAWMLILKHSPDVRTEKSRLEKSS